MVLSQRMALVRPAATVAVNARAAELRRQGVGVISLAAGEPDFPTPPHVVRAAEEAMAAGKTLYAPAAGLSELREAIAEKLERENGLSYSPMEIAVGNGAKQCIYSLCQATIDEGDEVLLPSPYWVSHHDIPYMFGAKVVTLQTNAENGYRITADQLHEAITPRSRWLILNSPNNPTGTVYTREELAALADVLRQPAASRVWVMSDDIYEHVLLEDIEFTNILNAAPDLRPRTVLVNGFSKVYAMTGWRLGYLAASEDLVKAVVSLHSQSTTSPSTITQWAGIAALQGPQDAIALNNARFLKRRDATLAALNATPGLSVSVLPQGAFYGYVDCRGWIGARRPDGATITNDSDAATFLLDHAHVALVPGVAFGSSPAFRVSFAASDESLEQACAQIRKAAATLS